MAYPPPGPGVGPVLVLGPATHVYIPPTGSLCYNPTPFFLLPDAMPLIGTPVQSTTPVPPVIFPSATPPELMGKAPLPLNPPSLLPLEDMPPRPEWTRLPPDIPQWTSPSQVVMTRPPSPAMSIYPSFDLPPVQPPTPIPWSTHHREYSSMEQLTEQPAEDPDSPMEDAPPIDTLKSRATESQAVNCLKKSEIMTEN